MNIRRLNMDMLLGCFAKGRRTKLFSGSMLGSYDTAFKGEPEHGSER